MESTRQSGQRHGPRTSDALAQGKRSPPLPTARNASAGASSFERLASWLGAGLGLGAEDKIDIDWNTAFRGDSSRSNAPSRSTPIHAPSQSTPPPPPPPPWRRRSSWFPEDADFELDWGKALGGKPLKCEAAGIRPVAQQPSASQPERQTGYSLALALRWFGSQAAQFSPGVGVPAAGGLVEQECSKGIDKGRGETEARVESSADANVMEDIPTSATASTTQLRLKQRRTQQLGLDTLQRLAKIRAMKGVSTTKDTAAATSVSGKISSTGDGDHSRGHAASSPLWLRAFDSERGIPYYYHRETFESRWLPPAAAARTPSACVSLKLQTTVGNSGSENKGPYANPMRPALADVVEL